MIPESRNADLTARAIAGTERRGDTLAELLAILDALRTALSTLVEPALNAPLNAADVLA